MYQLLGQLKAVELDFEPRSSSHWLGCLPEWFRCEFPQLLYSIQTTIRISLAGFPGGAVVENLPANAGDTGSSPGLGKSHMPRSN